MKKNMPLKFDKFAFGVQYGHPPPARPEKKAGE